MEASRKTNMDILGLTYYFCYFGQLLIVTLINLLGHTSLSGLSTNKALIE
ncbi:MAG: hypothetical protein JXR04_02165 [Bermanella sp.]|tara:strand:- start:3152 stop:3301 length:150 start_codon:yes stop_codon:yes gene_type:complete